MTSLIFFEFMAKFVETNSEMDYMYFSLTQMIRLFSSVIFDTFFIFMMHVYARTWNSFLRILSVNCTFNVKREQAKLAVFIVLYALASLLTISVEFTIIPKINDMDAKCNYWQAQALQTANYIWQLAINTGCFMVLYKIYFIASNTSSGGKSGGGQGASAGKGEQGLEPENNDPSPGTLIDEERSQRMS